MPTNRNRQSPMLPVACFALAFVGLMLGSIVPSEAQTFSSGSTGADGAFSPVSNTVLQVPASGVFNYTTINIPSNVIVTFTNSFPNVPVTMLATGDVTIWQHQITRRQWCDDHLRNRKRLNDVSERSRSCRPWRLQRRRRRRD